jgi:hypothetical protein
MYPGYDEMYPEDLREVLTEKEFSDAMTTINDTIQTFWPCFLCQSTARCCCLCTVGLSCFLPLCCINDAIHWAQRRIKAINEELEKNGRRVRFRLARSLIDTRLKVDVFPLSASGAAHASDRQQLLSAV